VYLPQGVGTALVNSLNKRANRPLVSEADTHVVKPGDTLSSISALYNIKLEQLMAINQLDSSLIKIGQTLAVADAGTRTPTHYIPFLSKFTILALNFDRLNMGRLSMRALKFA